MGYRKNPRLFLNRPLIRINGDKRIILELVGERGEAGMTLNELIYEGERLFGFTEKRIRMMVPIYIEQGWFRREN